MVVTTYTANISLFEIDFGLFASFFVVRRLLLCRLNFAKFFQSLACYVFEFRFSLH